MRPLYAGNPWAHTIYLAMIACWLISEALYFVRFGARWGTDNQDRLSGPALLAGVFLTTWIGSVVASGVPQAAIMWDRPLLFALGLVIAIAGIGFRFYSIQSLGRFFTLRVTTASDQVVVDQGPYRLVRHPSYAGALMTVFGVLLCSTNGLALLCFALAWPGFAYRIHTEEAALSSALGEPYRDYMRRTKRLIPYVL